LRRFIREVLHPSVGDVSSSVASDPFEVARRKIHRMRKPLFMECLRMRADFDPEYLGIVPPGPNRGVREAEVVQIEEDLALIGAEPSVRREFRDLASRRRRQMLDFRRLLCELGIEAYSAEAMRAMAIAYAIDYQKYIKENLEGHAKQMVGMLPSTFLGYNPDLFTYHKDLDKARKLLAEAGYPNGGFTLKYILDPGYEWKRPMGELLQDNLKELGIKVAIREVSNAAWNATLANPDTADHIYGLVWWPFVASPMDYFWSMCHKDAQAEGGWNWVYYDNPEVNERIEKLDSILDNKEWYDNVTRIQQILVDEVPYAPFYEAEYRLPMRDNVRGFIYNGLYTDTFTFYDMWKE